MIRTLIAVLFVLFAGSASAQQCIQPYNPLNGQPVGSPQCFGSNGWPIQNGQVLIGQQVVTFSGGQVSGCSSRLSISIGGRDGRLDFGTCLSQVQSNPGIRLVPVGQQQVQQGQAGNGTTLINNGTINVNGGSAGVGGGATATRREAYCEGNFAQEGDSCVERVGGVVMRIVPVSYRNVSANTPTVRGGNTCYLTDAAGNLVYDFFSTGSNNPLGRVVRSDEGSECLAAKRRYGMR